MAKWQHVTVSIASPDGKLSRAALENADIPGLAVTYTYREPEWRFSRDLPSECRVTHVASGLSIGGRLSQAKAKKLAKKLAPLADWTLDDQTTLFAKHPDLAEQVRDILEPEEEEQLSVVLFFSGLRSLVSLVEQVRLLSKDATIVVDGAHTWKWEAKSSDGIARVAASYLRAAMDVTDHADVSFSEGILKIVVVHGPEDDSRPCGEATFRIKLTLEIGDSK